MNLLVESACIPFVMEKSSNNTRRVHERAIMRAEEQMMRGEWRSEHSVQLNERIEFMKEKFEDFKEQHQKVVKKCNGQQFMLQDEYFAKIEQKYQHIVLCLRKLVHAAEQREKRCVENTVEQKPFGARVREFKVEGADGVQMMPQRDLRKFRMPLRADKRNARAPNDLRAKLQQNKLQLQRNNLQLRQVNERAREKMAFKRTVVMKKAGKPLKCHNCSRNHPMAKCVRFIQLSVERREERVDELGLCRNCFQPKGDKHKCGKSHRTHRCGKKEFHNSLLCTVERGQ